MSTTAKSTTHKITLTEAEQFFYDHDGYSMGLGEDKISAKIRCAIALARAEAYAENTGAEVTWEEDPDPDGAWCACGDDHGPAWIAVLRDAEGTVLGSLGGVTFESHDPSGEAYARVVAAELADEDLI